MIRLCPDEPLPREPEVGRAGVLPRGGAISGPRWMKGGQLAEPSSIAVALSPTARPRSASPERWGQSRRRHLDPPEVR
jgi:hypothetical protein